MFVLLPVDTVSCRAFRSGNRLIIVVIAKSNRCFKILLGVIVLLYS